MAEITEFRIPYLANSFVKSYVISTENYNIFVDSGIKRNEQALMPFLNSSKKNVCILTHGHWDHIGLNSVIKKAGGKLLGSSRDNRYYTDFKWDWEVGFEQYKKDYNVPDERYTLVWEEIGEETPLDGFVKEGDVLNFDDCEIHIIELPGHTRGCVGLYLPKEDILFTGDALMGPGFFGGATQYCDYLGYCESMKKIIGLNPETVYTAHTDVLENHSGAELAREGLEVGKKIEKYVDEFLDSTAEGEIKVSEIAAYVCEKIGRNFGGGACVSVISHLSLCKARDKRIEKCLSKYVYGV